MMSRLNVASWALLAGGIGQGALYSVLFTHLPPWTIFVVLLPPWLIVYTISFCRQAPFGPRRFRYCLVFAMSWYATTTVVAEILYALIRPDPVGHFPSRLAHLLICFGLLTFAVFIPACTSLRHLETKELH
jgi:hypothetical protein